MFAASIPPFGALLRHGGVAGANRTGRRLWRLLRTFAPMPPGTDTAGSADRR